MVSSYWDPINLSFLMFSLHLTELIDGIEKGQFDEVADRINNSSCYRIALKEYRQIVQSSKRNGTLSGNSSEFIINSVSFFVAHLHQMFLFETDYIVSFN